MFCITIHIHTQTYTHDLIYRTADSPGYVSIDHNLKFRFNNLGVYWNRETILTLMNIRDNWFSMYDEYQDRFKVVQREMKERRKVEKQRGEATRQRRGVRNCFCFFSILCVRWRI